MIGELHNGKTIRIATTLYTVNDSETKEALEYGVLFAYCEHNSLGVLVARQIGNLVFNFTTDETYDLS